MGGGGGRVAASPPPLVFLLKSKESLILCHIHFGTIFIGYKSFDHFPLIEGGGVLRNIRNMYLSTVSSVGGK